MTAFTDPLRKLEFRSDDHDFRLMFLDPVVPELSGLDVAIYDGEKDVSTFAIDEEDLGALKAWMAERFSLTPAPLPASSDFSMRVALKAGLVKSELAESKVYLQDRNVSVVTVTPHAEGLYFSNDDDEALTIGIEGLLKLRKYIDELLAEGQSNG